MNLANFALVLFLLSCIPAAVGQMPDLETRVRVSYQSGEEALRQGNLAAAEKDFLYVLGFAPQDVGARANLGVVFMREEKWNRALEYLNQAQKLAPEVAGIRLNVGLVYYKQANYAAALPAFESVLQKQPESVQARRLLGLCYLFTERYADAATALELLWPSLNGDVSYLYSLAVASGNAGRHDLETQAINQLSKVGKDSPFVHLLMGKAFLGHDDYSNALIEFQKAAEADAKLPMVHYNLGVVYRRRGEPEKARLEFLKDAAMEPNVAFNYDQLGMLAAADGKDHVAEGYFLQAVKFDSKLGTSWFGLAKAYKQQKQYSDALKALQEAGSLDASSASVHYLRAQVLVALGRKNEAEAEFAAVQKLKKDDVDKLENEVSGARYKDPGVPAQ